MKQDFIIHFGHLLYYKWNLNEIGGHVNASKIIFSLYNQGSHVKKPNCHVTDVHVFKS